MKIFKKPINVEKSTLFCSDSAARNGAMKCASIGCMFLFFPSLFLACLIAGRTNNGEQRRHGLKKLGRVGQKVANFRQAAANFRQRKLWVVKILVLLLISQKGDFRRHFLFIFGRQFSARLQFVRRGNCY